jgi:hypothetical protein
VGQQEFLAIAISADLAEEFVGPCGACRSTYFRSTPPPAHPLLEVENIGIKYKNPYRTYRTVPLIFDSD